MAEDIRIRFACGHTRLLGSDAGEVSVECETCGERRVSSVTAPPPRFRGVNCAVEGPHVSHV